MAFNQKASYAEKVYALLKSVWLVLFWLVLLLMASRLAMFYSFVSPEELIGHEQDVVRMWIMGLRYDARVCALMLAPIFVLGLILCVGYRSWRFFLRLATLLFACSFFITTLFAIVNYYYYETYHNYIDIFVFGLAGEDKGAVLQNIWQEYPVPYAILALFLLTLLPLLLVRRILRRPEQARACFFTPPPPAVRPIFFAFFLFVNAVLLFTIARGGWGTFPLNRNSAQISSVEVINKLTPNGIMTLHWARKDYNTDARFDLVDAEQGRKLLRLSGLPALTELTPANPWLAEHQPHVVLAIMESFGSNMLALDHLPENDSLGALRSHFEHDFLFRRFLPEGNGTAPSLAAMLFLSPKENISHSSAQKNSLSYTPFKVYKEAGYDTVFIYPGNMMWRNMAAYLPRQGVDKLYDQNDLIELYPEAKNDSAAWGVPDEYAYRLAEKLLAESDKPMFMVILTTTNHPPYNIPSVYTPGPLNMDADMLEHFADNAEQATQMMGTFQYSADCLGNFLGRIKASSLGGKVLAAATGDHQMRRMINYQSSDKALILSVPFYLYVPQEILRHTEWSYDYTRPGSHKDILPTLYSFSLSQARYLALGGRSLLLPVDDVARAFGYNDRMWITDGGAFVFSKGAWVKFPWAAQVERFAGGKAYGKFHLLLEAEENQLENHEESARMTAYPKLLDWQINARVNGQDVE